MKRYPRLATFATFVISFTFTARDCFAQSPRLLIDRASGSGSIVGGSSAVELTGYSIQSSNLLRMDGWHSLEDQAVPGWFEANPKESVIGELNPVGSTLLEPGSEALQLGAVFATGLRPSAEDVEFLVSLANGDVVNGEVNYLGAPNDVVLRVDPESGVGRLEMMSPHVEYELTGYSIESESGGLSDEWKSLADVHVAGWEESKATSTVVTEFVESGSTLLSNGSVFWLGTVLQPNDDPDLTLTFSTLQSESLVGTVIYSPLIEPIYLDADFNESGTVDLADFLFLSRNFGKTVETPGDDPDLDADGSVGFTDFLTLSRQFGKSIDIGKAKLVPEPSGQVLFWFGVFVLAYCRGHLICRGVL